MTVVEPDPLRSAIQKQGCTAASPMAKLPPRPKSYNARNCSVNAMAMLRVPAATIMVGPCAVPKSQAWLNASPPNLEVPCATASLVPTPR